MKPFWQSRTFWLNLLGAGAAGLEIVADILPPEWQAYAVAAYGILNIILRFDTKEPVTFKVRK